LSAQINQPVKLLNNYLHPLQELRTYLAARAKVLVVNSLFTVSVLYTPVSNRHLVELQDLRRSISVTSVLLEPVTEVNLTVFRL